MIIMVKFKNGGVKTKYHKLFNDFVKFLYDNYKLEEDIDIEFLGRRVSHMSTGSDSDKHVLRILTKGRLNRDILRTLSHEWIHEYQKQISKIKGKNKIEDEANMIAGRLLKSFEKQNPNLEKKIYNRD